MPGFNTIPYEFALNNLDFHSQRAFVKDVEREGILLKNEKENRDNACSDLW